MSKRHTSAAAGEVGALQPAESWPRLVLTGHRRRIPVPTAAALLPQPPSDHASVTFLYAPTHGPTSQHAILPGLYKAKPNPSWEPEEPTSWHVRLRRTRCARHISEQQSV